MNTPSEDPLDSLFRHAARDAVPLEMARNVSRGLEARVQQRLSRPIAWGDAFFNLCSWRPAVMAAALVIAAGSWSGRSLVDVLDDEWLTAQIDDVDEDDPLTPSLFAMEDDAEL